MGTSRSKPRNQARFLEAFAMSDGFILESCKVTGITTKTYHQWMREDEEFKAQIDYCKEALERRYTVALDKIIHEGNVTAIIFKLKSLNPERYDDAIRKLKYEQQNFEQNKDKFVLPRIEVNIIPKSEIDYEPAMVGSRSDPRS